MSLSPEALGELFLGRVKRCRGVGVGVGVGVDVVLPQLPSTRACCPEAPVTSNCTLAREIILQQGWNINFCGSVSDNPLKTRFSSSHWRQGTEKKGFGT